MEELTTIHIKTPKKEIKKRKKMEDDAIRHRMYELFKTYNNRIQNMLLDMTYDEMVKWIVNMEKSIEEANSFHLIDMGEYLKSRKKIVYHDNYFDIPKSQEAAYEKFIKDKKLRCVSDVVKARRAFIDKMEKMHSKYRKKKGLNLYDPLFHGVDTDLDQMKRNLKRLNADNKRRVDAFLADLSRLTGEDASHIPVVKAFKEKTERIMKRTSKFLDSMGIGQADLVVEF